MLRFSCRFAFFINFSSKSILIILRYTISKLVRFLRHGVVPTRFISRHDLSTIPFHGAMLHGRMDPSPC